MVNQRVLAAFAAVLLLLGGCSGKGPLLEDLERAAGSVLAGGGAALSSDEIARGLKQALSIGSTNVVGQVGAKDGFNADPVIHIPLPKALSNARDFAAKVGFEGAFDNLETRLNRAAESAAPRARQVFLDAIGQMSLTDAREILQGPDNAATEYFRRTAGPGLFSGFKPIVDRSLAEVGAVRAFDRLLKSYRQIPLAPAVDADLSSHVVERAMQGIFHYVAREEKAIRENPLRRTTDLLKRVFASTK